MSDDIKLTFDVLEGKNTLNPALDSSTKKATGLQGAINALKTNFSNLGAVIAPLTGIATAFFGAFTIGKAIEAASESEQAINRLNIALKLSGDYSDQASQSLQDYASQIQATTAFEDDLILSQLALAKSFGATNEQAKKIVSAAADLSVAFGIDINTAVEQVSKTLNGSVGLLGKSIPELQGISKEALRAGEAIDIISKKFGGSAAADVRTFAGATAQTKNAFGDLLEEIGNIIIKNPKMIKSLNEATVALNGISAAIAKNRDKIIGILNFIGTAVIRTMEVLTNGIIILFHQPFVQLEKFYNYLLNRFPQLQKIFGEANASTFAGMVQESEIAANEAAKKIADAFRSTFSDQKIVKPLKDNLAKNTKKGIEEGFEKAKPDLEKFKIEHDLALDQFNSVIASVNTVIGSFTDTASLISNSAAAFLTYGGGLQKIFDLFDGTGFGDIFKPLQDAISKLFPAEMFGPIASVAKQLVQVFAQSPEQFQKMMNDLIANIPILISNIIINLANLFGGKIVDSIIVNLINNLPYLIESIVTALVTSLSSPIFWMRVSNAAALAFIKSIPHMVQGFIDGLRNGIADAIKPISDVVNFFYEKIAKSAIYFIQNILEGAKRFIEKLIDEIGSFGSGLFGGGGGFNILDPGSWFSKGGIAYANRGLFTPRGTDTVPAMYTPGELVVDRTTTNDLKKFLENNASGSTIESLLAQILRALLRPQMVNTSININQRELAKAILEINQNNFRTA